MSKVAIIQPWFEDRDTKATRISYIEKLIDSLAGVDLIVLPELWNIGWWSFEAYKTSSETLKGETITRIAAKAKTVKTYVLAGSIIERKGDDLYNTAILINREGKIIATYSKMHLAHHMEAREAELLKRGDNIVTAKTELGVIGLSICYDMRFPELYRKMAIRDGAEILVNVAAWPLIRLDHWRQFCQVRAIENFCYFIGCGMAGFDHGRQYVGHSMVIDPSGVTIAATGLYESIIKTEIDLKEVYKARERIPAIKDIVISP